MNRYVRVHLFLVTLCVLLGFSGGAEAQTASTTIQGMVSIDARQTSEPISPYIYGQFIEHLGRCIYGGIWAEMLEDRKFYYPVTGEAPPWTMFTPGPRSWDGEGHPYELLTRSPWLIVGPQSGVTMVRNNSFVGAQTPKITLPGNGEPAGLLQERLGVVRGNDYTGRIVVAGSPTAAPIEVSLVWGIGAGDRDTVTIDEIDSSYATTPLAFTAGRSTDNARIEIVSKGSGHFLVGTLSLMPADNIRGWRADTVALMKRLDAPVYRWPGGNFVSGYNWRDGIGDPDKRPPRKNPAWKGIEHNDVGIHEFMDLCRQIDTEAFIAVNTGLGGVEETAAEVEYVNGAANTKHGKLRAKNGHPEPYGVKWWAVGNEMYGDWQLGHMPLSEYVKKHNRVVDAMRAVDPTIKPIGVGAAGDWSRQMLTTCADHMNLISEHLYWQDKDDLVAHVAQLPAEIRRVGEVHRQYRHQLDSLEGKDIRIAMDEWNYWYGGNEYGELGVRYFLQDALGITAGLHEFFRNSDIYFMANYAQTVNVIGCIKTTKTQAAFDATALPLMLYRKQFGSIPVNVDHSVDPLDVAAAVTEDKKALTIGIVNPTWDTYQLSMNFDHVEPTKKARTWVITGDNPLAYNEPGRRRNVTLTAASPTDLTETVSIKPLSITLLKAPIR
jgi:alpha-L-arabinofuranosidase